MERQYVMGVSTGGHGCAALLCNGRVVVAIDQQRVASGEDNPAPGAAALRYCLDSAGIGWDDVALLVESDISDPSRHLEVPRHVRRIGIPGHLAHAYGAATESTFHDATVAVLCRPSTTGGDEHDVGATGERRHYPIQRAAGNGGPPARPSWLYGLLGGSVVTPPRPEVADGIGQPWALLDFYQQITTYLFGTTAAGDRLAPLAARGRPGGFAARHADFLDDLDPDRSAANRREPFTAHLEYYADIARCAQDLLGNALVDLLRGWHARFPSPNLVYAGDLTCNTALNRRIASETPFEQVFLHPVAGDAGAAVGCCYYGWAEVLEETAPPQHDSDLCFGRSYAGDRVAGVAESAAREPYLAVDRPDDLIVEVVALLAAGQTVGWFEGGGELGSRALGHRSVLSGARSADSQKRFTRFIGRPDFAPPAAIIRAEDCADVFELPDLSRHQVLSARIRSRWAHAMRAVAHDDGTAVVQCVTGSSHRRLHQLLSAWSRVSRPPVLSNDRLGPFDGPLVETPEQALAFLTGSPLAALVLEDRLIRKVDRR